MTDAAVVCLSTASDLHLRCDGWKPVQDAGPTGGGGGTTHTDASSDQSASHLTAAVGVAAGRSGWSTQGWGSGAGATRRMELNERHFESHVYVCLKR